MTAELNIPTAAIVEGHEAIHAAAAESFTFETLCRAALVAAAPLIVAAELRREADELDALADVGEKGPNPSGVKMLRKIAAKLRARADELDPQGGES
jgi:hypothetical protein